MKNLYDHYAEIHQFSPGDQVLTLLPLVGSPLQAKFHCPFTVLRQISEQNYLLSTPKRRRNTQLCHVNLLKPYCTRGSQFCARGGGQQQTVQPVVMAETVARHSAAELSGYEDDGVVSPDESLLRGRLKNSEKLGNLESLFGHLSKGLMRRVVGSD